MDPEFLPDHEGLAHALALLGKDFAATQLHDLPTALPEEGLGSRAVLDVLGPRILGRAARLGEPTAFAHMDPPTPWVTWAATLWNASLNQNLLHPATAPVAREIEARVIGWLAPYFGMEGGHMTPGSTVANLTALWAARECAGVDEVVASQSAHVSIAKAAHILGLRYRAIPVQRNGAMDADSLTGDLSRAAVVLTAGTTSTGAIDPLEWAGRAAWTHVDAAWAGPLRLSPKYADRLAGIERADSVAVSTHKWFFQPKESALVLFRDTARAHAAISFGGAYLAVPNVGVLGSHGATAVPLLAMLMAWGREGLVTRIERCMSLAEEFAGYVSSDARFELLAAAASGVVVWRPTKPDRFEQVLLGLPPSAVSVTTLEGVRWLRNVAANPNADVRKMTEAISALV
ncbi:MAG: aspartate aminotransferase family protein [Proteobacteria bacterium]|nr:aspartate aminotransferase family protein [Pseudomonadota bacterium]